MLGFIGLNKPTRRRNFSLVRSIENLSLYDLNFAANTYKNCVQDFNDPYNNNNFYRPYVNYTARLDLNQDGSYTLNPANRLKRTNKGLWIHQDRTNYVLWNRDLTNAAWTKTNITATKNQTGILNVANSASLIAATADAATITQAITLAATSLFCSAFVKRISGTGTLEMTMDGGATWIPITVTSSWTRVNLPTANFADPTIGFRIGTNGDSFAIDFAQIENGNTIGAPLETTTAAFHSWTDRPASYSATTNHDFPDYIQTKQGYGFYLEISAARLEEFFTIGFSSSPSVIAGVRADGSVYIGPAQTAAGTFTRGWDTVNKIAGFYHPDGSAAIACNGAVSALASGSPLTAVDHHDLCTNGSGGSCAHGYVPRVAFFNPNVLTTTDLVNFTMPS